MHDWWSITDNFYSGKINTGQGNCVKIFRSFFRAFVSGEWKSLIVLLNYRFDSYQSEFPSQSDQFFSVFLNVVATGLPFDPGFHLTLTLLITEKQIKTYGSFRTMLKISLEHGIILIESPSDIWLALLARKKWWKIVAMNVSRFIIVLLSSTRQRNQNWLIKNHRMRY